MRYLRVYSNNKKYIYDVYENGYIYDVKKDMPLKTSIAKNGYLQAYIHYNDKGKMWGVHRFIMFVLNPVENMEKLEVNHINGNKLDNRLCNLEWCTSSENKIHAFKIGLMTQSEEHNAGAKLSDDQFIEICELLQNGEKIKNIAKKYNVSNSLIYAIRDKSLRNYISEKYTFSKRRRLNIEEAEEICQMIKDGYTSKEISENLNIQITLVQNIKYKKSWIKISEKYGI